MEDTDIAIREAAVRHRRDLTSRWGEAVPYAELARGFPFQGQWLKLTGPQGVFKPKELRDGALTLLSTLASRYEDEALGVTSSSTTTPRRSGSMRTTA